MKSSLKIQFFLILAALVFSLLEAQRDVDLEWSVQGVQSYGSSSPLQINLGDTLIFKCVPASYSNVFYMTGEAQFTSCDGSADDVAPSKLGICTNAANEGRNITVSITQDSEAISEFQFQPNVNYYFASFSFGNSPLSALNDSTVGGQCSNGLRLTVRVNPAVVVTSEPNTPGTQDPGGLISLSDTDIVAIGVVCGIAFLGFIGCLIGCLACCCYYKHKKGSVVTITKIENGEVDTIFYPKKLNNQVPNASFGNDNDAEKISRGKNEQKGPKKTIDKKDNPPNKNGTAGTEQTDSKKKPKSTSNNNPSKRRAPPPKPDNQQNPKRGSSTANGTKPLLNGQEKTGAGKRPGKQTTKTADDKPVSQSQKVNGSTKTPKPVITPSTSDAVDSTGVAVRRPSRAAPIKPPVAQSSGSSKSTQSGEPVKKVGSSEDRTPVSQHPRSQDSERKATSSLPLSTGSGNNTRKTNVYSSLTSDSNRSKGTGAHDSPRNTPRSRTSAEGIVNISKGRSAAFSK